MERNLWNNDFPSVLYTATHKDYKDFLISRRKIKGSRNKNFYEQLE